MCESDSGENWDGNEDDELSNDSNSAITCRVSINQVWQHFQICILSPLLIIFLFILTIRFAGCLPLYHILSFVSIIC